MDNKHKNRFSSLIKSKKSILEVFSILNNRNTRNPLLLIMDSIPTKEAEAALKYTKEDLICISMSPTATPLTLPLENGLNPTTALNWTKNTTEPAWNQWKTEKLARGNQQQQAETWWVL